MKISEHQESLDGPRGHKILHSTSRFNVNAARESVEKDVVMGVCTEIRKETCSHT